MSQITVGLTNNKTSFWDPNTSTYITLDKPVQTIQIGSHTDLSRICNAIFGSVPCLKLYEGKIPEEEIQKWKARYNFPGLQMAKDRAVHLNDQSGTKDDVVGASVQTNAEDNGIEMITEPMNVEDMEGAISAEEIEAMTKAEMIDYINENKLEIEFGSRTSAGDLKQMLLEYFNFTN